MIPRKCDLCGKTEEVGDDITKKPGEAFININYNYQTYNLCKDCTKKLIGLILAGRKE